MPYDGYFFMPIDYPPYFFLIKVFDNCPGAIFVYILLWKNHREDSFVVPKNDIREKYLTFLQNFREYLLSLENLSLLNFEEEEKSFRITLNKQEINAKGYMLC